MVPKNPRILITQKEDVENKRQSEVGFRILLLRTLNVNNKSFKPSVAVGEKQTQYRERLN